MRLEVSGQARLRAVGAQIKATGDRGLGREMSAALRKASVPVQASIKAEFTRALPAGGGYQALFAKSLRFRTEVKNSSRSAFFRVITFADGTSERRDINAINAGRLRHPVYGRSRNTSKGRIPNPWSMTKVNAGAFERGTKDAMRQAEKQMVGVLDDFAARLAGKG